jgi:hypothetical protein
MVFTDRVMMNVYHVLIIVVWELLAMEMGTQCGVTVRIICLMATLTLHVKSLIVVCVTKLRNVSNTTKVTMIPRHVMGIYNPSMQVVSVLTTLMVTPTLMVAIPSIVINALLGLTVLRLSLIGLSLTRSGHLLWVGGTVKLES